MARGRPLVSNVGFFTSHRRSASLPADESRLSQTVSYDLGGAESQKANIIASQAAHDSDAIISASRRHDRDFLHNVATKLSNINTIRAAPPAQKEVSSHVIRSRPPISPRTVAARSQAPAGIYRSALSPDEHLEIATYLQREPSRPTVRAASLPPLSTRPSVPRWFPSSSASYGRARYGGPSTVPTGMPPTSTYGQPSDAVVGVAHTSVYGDIVIGIPYKKRFMFNAQHDTDSFDTQSLPPIHVNVPTRVSSAPAHYHSTAAAGSHTRNLSQPYSRASYAGPYNASDVGHVITTSGSDVDDVISIKSYPAPTAARTPRRSQKTRDIEEDIANSIFGDTGAVPPTTASKDYKTVLSRYVPSNGPKTSLTTLSDKELDRKYGQILTSMQPKLSPRPSVTSSTSQAKEYSHSSLPPPGPQKPKRPAMSGARKKLRDLLCRSKGNPHYFEDNE